MDTMLSPFEAFSVTQATELLAKAAKTDPSFVHTRLSSAGFQISGSIPEEKPEAASAASEAYVIGKLVEGEGIYFGIHEPQNRKGRSLGKKFNLFADIKDLTDKQGIRKRLSFEEAVKENAGRKKRFGIRGVDYPVDGYADAFYKAIKNGTYTGEWLVPTRELLHGMGVAGSFVQHDNLCDYRGRGDFVGTYQRDREGYWNDSTYMSCSESADGAGKWIVNFTNGGAYPNRSHVHANVRLVRLKEIAPGA